jgi:hypothetical protein
MNDKLKHSIINYLNEEYSGLIIYKTDKWEDIIFFMKNDKVIFYYNKKNGCVYISYDKIWSFLESFFGLEYKEIQDLTKQWVEEQFKLGVTSTRWKPLGVCLLVEEQFKLGVTSTGLSRPLYLLRVEKQFKLETNDR